MKLFNAALVAVAALPFAASLPTIARKGSFLFDSSTGDRFYLKGLAYAANYGSGQTPPSGQVSEVDPLANGPGCARDIPYFKQLDVNILRVYQVNSSLDHSSCMSALESAGIYVLVDLATQVEAISGSSPAWNLELLTQYINTIEVFGQYSNVFGFNIGNEVISSLADDQAAPYIKSAVRDVKAFMSAHNYSQLVGYTGTDSPNSRATLPYYLACGEDSSSIFDYWGLNIYEWCGNSDFQTSGYSARTQELANLGIPAFFSEYGCNAVEPRAFQDVPVLYSSDMSNVWSGGIIYEYIEQSNAYGLVNISSDGSSVSTLTDFNNLKSQYATATGSSLASASYSPSISLPDSCPMSNASWPVATSLPPTPNSGLCDCIASQLSCISTYSLDDAGQIGTAIGTICGTSSQACSAITGNGTSGSYGDLSMCNPLQQLNIAMEIYYNEQSRTSSACQWAFATLASSASISGTAQFSSATSSCVAADAFASSTGIPTATTTLAGVSTHPLVSARRPLARRAQAGAALSG
ncbi:Glucanosyltransferase-domain-containing protein [Fomitopsis serialis]|uniref:Glucanosyltransferase-domain-containing protein n=1 Tax=Fomitopsis serialis TaxID=139415 RepID=UPI002007217F|nr:Glucanosyltransferase-domain-containing protein [Neoantrodia serialis]KAH9911985.1 Glucanosyltransferase-domain-containing protein [Neoantrodia serialis]